MKRTLVVVLFGGILLSACGALPWGNPPAAPMMPDARDWYGGDFASNGERIYFTGTNQDGERIDYTGGPDFGGMMMGFRVSCASCHGSDGQGGLHAMHMDVMDAPAITYEALAGEAGEHAEGEEDGHEHGHGEYDLEAFRRAVVEGEHPGGEPLSRDMPRWQMSDEDLADLFEFLKTLD